MSEEKGRGRREAQRLEWPTKGRQQPPEAGPVSPLERSSGWGFGLEETFVD